MPAHLWPSCGSPAATAISNAYWLGTCIFASTCLCTHPSVVPVKRVTAWVHGGMLCRMLATFSTHMEPGTLQAGLTVVPSSCWLSVVPQLMAALARSCSSTAVPSEKEAAGQGGEAAVRQAVLSVLRRLGQDAPFQVLLPALIELREPHAGACRSKERLP